MNELAIVNFVYDNIIRESMLLLDSERTKYHEEGDYGQNFCSSFVYCKCLHPKNSKIFWDFAFYLSAKRLS